MTLFLIAIIACWLARQLANASGARVRAWRSRSPPIVEFCP